MRFTKMHGLGNDYLYVFGEVPDDVAALSKRLSDRHFSVGSDGMIYIGASEVADFQMRIFNADGSEGAMCGNGIRCVGKYVFDKGLTDKTSLTIETASGIKTLRLAVEDGVVVAATVNMGKAVVGDTMSLAIAGERLTCTPASMGNPHAVFFTDDVCAVPLETIGPAIEHHGAFPGGVNAEFVQVLSERTLRMRVWERGSGITMACGTGASATTAVAVSRGICPHDVPITVVLDGGELEIQVSRDFEVTMTGPAETAFEGEVLL